MKLTKTTALWLLFSACGHAALGAAEPQCVNASSFGWNAADATACLQAAIDSGAKKVVIDRQAGDWIVEPIFLRVSGQEVVVADGVTVRAKKGSFKGRSDCLFKISGKDRGVTLRGEGKATLVMNKHDYQNPENYLFSGWRHVVSIAGSGTTVSNLTILSSGGDGVYVTGAARDVTLEDLVSRDHFRQGISVISAVRLRVRRCRFEETAGAAPQCGVDIEPNRPTDSLEDILFEDCVFDRNVAGGITLHLGGLKRPVSITFRRCVARGNMTGISVYTSRNLDRPTTGTVLFEGCKVSGNSANALRFCNLREGGITATIRNCSFDARGTEAAPVLFDNGNLPANVSGVTFENSRMIADVPADKAFAFVGVDGAGIVPGGLKGTLTLERQGGSKELLDLEAFAKRHPSNPERFAALLAFKTCEVDWRGIAAQPGAQPLERPASTGWLRGQFTFVQAFPGSGDYPVVFRTKRLGNRSAEAKVQMRDAAGTDLGTFTIGDCETVTNVIHAHGAGIRRYEVICGLAAVESRWPGQGVLADFKVPLFGGKNRRFFFTVPADAESVSVQVRPAERCSARLMRPDGTVVAEAPYDRRQMSVLTVPREKTSAPEVWSVVFPQVEEDALFRTGAPALPIVATGTPEMALGPAESGDPVPKKVTRRICLLENGDIGKYWYTWVKKVQKRGEDPERVFTAEGTTLKVSGADMGCVTTRDAYRDYRLTLEFRYVDNDVQLNKTAARDGGILFHSTGRDGVYGNGIWMSSFEYNVIQGAAGDLIVVGSKKDCPGVYRCKGRVDPATKGKSSQHWDQNGPEIALVDSGRIRRPDVDLEWKNLKTQALSPNENPIGEWNTAEVVCRGDTAEFYFNGMKTGEYRDMHPSAGRIQLQSEGFGIEYRNIVLSPLD